MAPSGGTLCAVVSSWSCVRVTWCWVVRLAPYLEMPPSGVVVDEISWIRSCQGILIRLSSMTQILLLVG